MKCHPHVHRVAVPQGAAEAGDELAVQGDLDLVLEVVDPSRIGVSYNFV